MAGELGISVSYLNLIERNERPLTAQLLIKLSESYDVDPRSFAQEEEQRSNAELEEIFADPVFQQAPVPRSEIKSISEDAPGMTLAIKRLYRAYIEIREFQSGAASRLSEHERGEALSMAAVEDPVETVRSFLERANNYFPDLERKAEEVALETSNENVLLLEAIAARLLRKHGTRVQITPIDAMRKVLRHYDRHRKKLMISELVGTTGRTFQAAFHLGLLEAGEELDAITTKAGIQGHEAQKLARISLANYFAAAVMMPYQKFAEAADTLSYDLDVLCARFSASFEQVTHRLTTLARPTHRRVPFFMIRVDAAGNISKRFSSGTFPFSRYGGTCARWSIHSAFRNPGHIEREVVEMPDGTKWFSISRTVERRATPWEAVDAQFVVALGCELKHAHRLVYSRGLDFGSHQATLIGINCRLCERPDCAQRAAPALMRRFNISETTRGLSPFEIEQRT